MPRQWMWQLTSADAENKWIVNCINTGKLCVFTNTGKMHQIKVLDLPYGKFRDKGQPIDNVSNYDSTQEMVVYMCDELQLRYAKLLFATKQGMIKKVKGNEFRWQNVPLQQQSFRRMMN